MSRWHHCSIRTRLAVMAGAVMALLCTAVAVFVAVSVRHTEVEYRTQQLLAYAVVLAKQLREHTVPARLATAGPDTAIQVFNPADTMVAATPGTAGKPPMTSMRPDVDAFATTTSCDTPQFPGRCAIVLAYPFHRSDGVYQLDMAVPDVPWYVGPELLIPITLGWLLLVGVSAMGSRRIVGKTLEPVSAISGKLAQITASDLGHRVPVPKYRDELRDLAETANRTLDRAQSAIEQQLRFASDASHDLRSPLTAMRAQIEEALIYPGATEWPQAADALLESVERMQALVTDLLQVARLDAGVTSRREVISLSGLVRAELERRRAKTTLRQHRLTPGVIVDGSRTELTRLLNNLLDNAERHATSSVAVTLALEAGTAVLEVCDDGDGVAHEQREVIFQRFTRLEASRARDAGGTGLGLPIARQIAEAHGGTLTIEDSPFGARFVLRLPVQTSPDAGSTNTRTEPPTNEP
ncbi:HAMP domain-containing sensor histidine kinase [Nonomuraea jiangxiensis]|uniref:HAMP domain-containing sensor histidine kinase n=1 Tax=Nonomuraea jiangxiensis TaxID=633440 RepID=UPI0015A16417|nr:HAMP domain-containing sensor histidine kinase [Nonomuraea jiangxiensis]